MEIRAVFFFVASRRRHTRSLRDWSSDVCSSDLCAHGLAGAGGMGRLVAEWIVNGRPEIDAWEMDSRRFGRHYMSRDYTLARTVEIYSTYYDVKYPGFERSAGRPLRTSPAYPRLSELGASFGEKSG